MSDERLRSELDRAERRGRDLLRDERGRRAVREQLPTYSWGLVGVAVVLLLVAVFRRLFTTPADDQSWWMLVGFAGFSLLALPVVVLVERAKARNRSFHARDGLSRIDRELGLLDRLPTAHEFIGRGDRGPFMQAAIEDAEEAARRANTEPLPEREPAPLVHPDVWRRVAGAAVVLLLAIWIAPRGTGIGVPTSSVGDIPSSATEATEARAPDVPPTVPPEPERPTESVDPRKGTSPPSAEATAGELPEQAKDARGATGVGDSAEAAAATGASRSKGTPSGQGQVSVPDDKERKPRPRKPAKKPEDEDDTEKEPKPGERSGATAGSGASGGSNRNPSTTEWTSKDQVTQTEEDPLEHDEDVDDEESDQEARGGVQPMLRDRRPPANRDLTIGFGNEPNPDANGRGGPSQMKKSRGVASLVLGVPIPDHVKGQSNPGRTKITQERIEPREDDRTPASAGARTPRASPIGAVEPLPLGPWLRRIVRSYFLRDSGSTPQQSAAPSRAPEDTP